MDGKQNEERVILVGRKSERDTIAGALAGMIRANYEKPVALKTASPEGVVTTVMSIIRAQWFLNDPKYPGNVEKVGLSVAVSEDRHKRNGVIFFVRARRRR